MDDDVNGENQEPTDSFGPNDFTLSLPQICVLERDSVEERLREMADNSADMNWSKI